MPCGRQQTNANINEPAPNSVVVRARSAFQTIYLQKITYSPLGIVAGTVLAFIDSLTGQSVGLITVMPSSVAQPPYVIDYSLGDSASSGTPISQGANLVISVLSGGITGRLHIKAYQIPLYVVAPYVAPMTAGFTK